MVPLPPVVGMNINPRFGLCLYPAAENTSAGENERMRAIGVENREFKVTIKRRRGNRLPLT